jgi:hypothetical protein
LGKTLPVSPSQFASHLGKCLVRRNQLDRAGLDLIDAPAKLFVPRSGEEAYIAATTSIIRTAPAAPTCAKSRKWCGEPDRFPGAPLSPP